MHVFGTIPKTCILSVARSVPFHYIRFRFSNLRHMNQKNTIKGLIPQRLLVLVPPADRDKWADRIVEKFKAQNPECYATIGEWRSVPDEEREDVVNKILSAAELIHREIRDESK